jgi:hypothetical protein
VARIKVYLGDDQPSTAGPDRGFAGGSMQLLGSPTVHYDGHSSSKKRKVSFAEPTPQPVGDNEEPPDLSQSLTNVEAPLEVPATTGLISADAEEVHEMADNTKKKKTNKKKGKTVNSTSEDLGKEVQADIAVEASGDSSTKTTKGHVYVSENTPYNAAKLKKRPRTSTTDKSIESTKALDDAAALRIDDAEGYSKSSKKLKHKRSEDLENGVMDPTDDNQVDPRAKSLEDSQRHIGQADPSEVDLTRPPKKAKMRQKKKEVVILDQESNGALSAPISATSNSAIVMKRVVKGIF